MLSHIRTYLVTLSSIESIARNTTQSVMSVIVWSSSSTRSSPQMAMHAFGQAAICGSSRGPGLCWLQRPPASRRVRVVTRAERSLPLGGPEPARCLRLCRSRPAQHRTRAMKPQGACACPPAARPAGAVLACQLPLFLDAPEARNLFFFFTSCTCPFYHL